MLLAKWSNTEGVFDALKKKLSLTSTAVREGENREQLIETSVFMLGESPSIDRLFVGFVGFDGDECVHAGK